MCGGSQPFQVLAVFAAMPCWSGAAAIGPSRALARRHGGAGLQARAARRAQLEIGQRRSLDGQSGAGVARISGILSMLAVKEGDYVKKGQVIGRIVDSQLGYESGAYGAQAAAARRRLHRRKPIWRARSFLYNNGVYAKARLEQAAGRRHALLRRRSALRGSSSRRCRR